MARRSKSLGKRAKRDSYHHGNLRAALIDAAAAMLEGHPEADISLREAARRAAVSPAAPYRHFADKNALLAAVAEDGYLLLLDDLRLAALPYEAEPAEALIAIGLAYVSFAQTQPARFRLMFAGAIDAEVLAASGDPALANAQEDLFETLSGFAASREAALGAWALMHGLAMLAAQPGSALQAGAEPGLEAVLRATMSALV